MKLYKDYYEYKTISFSFFKKGTHQVAKIYPAGRIRTQKVAKS